MKNKINIICVMTMIILVITSCAPARRMTPLPSPRATTLNRIIPKRIIPKASIAPLATPYVNRKSALTPSTTPFVNPGSASTPKTTPYVSKPNDGAAGKTTTDLTKRAQKISAETCKINTIKSATTIITGNTALIGIQLKPNSEGKANDIKSTVDKKVKESDKLIKKVVVTIDPSLYKRIENIGKSISQGKPLSGFVKELNEIINRIMPK